MRCESFQGERTNGRRREPSDVPLRRATEAAARGDPSGTAGVLAGSLGELLIILSGPPRGTAKRRPHLPLPTRGRPRAAAAARAAAPPGGQGGAGLRRGLGAGLRRGAQAWRSPSPRGSSCLTPSACGGSRRHGYGVGGPGRARKHLFPTRGRWGVGPRPFWGAPAPAPQRPPLVNPPVKPAGSLFRKIAFGAYASR